MNGKEQWNNINEDNTFKDLNWWKADQLVHRTTENNTKRFEPASPVFQLLDILAGRIRKAFQGHLTSNQDDDTVS